MRPSLLVKALLTVPMLALLLLAGCGPASSGGNANGPCKGAKVTVGGKLDTEAQLLTEMYTLLLKNAGCDVTERAKLGTNQIVFQAITSGQIDLYPEFTATGLAQLGESTTHDAQQDFQLVKQGYEEKYQITWLDAAPMNDTYGICTSQDNATKYNVSKVSDLIPIASQYTLATPPDGQSDPNVIPALESVYGIKFGTETVLDENLTFQAVQKGDAQFNICYTTNGLISADNFVLLDDDKSVFPIYNPAPIVRDSKLKEAPAIADALNPLAPKLTTAEITKLNAEVAVNNKTVHEVAQDWLKEQGLLS